MKVLLNRIVIKRIQFGDTFWKVIGLEVPSKPMPCGLKAVFFSHKSGVLCEVFQVKIYEGAWDV